MGIRYIDGKCRKDCAGKREPRGRLKEKRIKRGGEGARLPVKASQEDLNRITKQCGAGGRGKGQAKVCV